LITLGDSDIKDAGARAKASATSVAASSSAAMQPAPSTPNHDEFGAYDQFDEAITANSPIRPRSLPASSQVDKRTPQGFVVITQADVYTHVFLKLEEEQHVCEQQLLLCASCGQSTLTQSAICALGE
jgi:hypothetical protein